MCVYVVTVHLLCVPVWASEFMAGEDKFPGVHRNRDLGREGAW